MSNLHQEIVEQLCEWRPSLRIFVSDEALSAWLVFEGPIKQRIEEIKRYIEEMEKETNFVHGTLYFSEKSHIPMTCARYIVN
jgi:hypothetical protein